MTTHRTFRILLIVLAASLAAATQANEEPAAMELWRNRFPYVSRWLGPKGVGTATLISPKWCLTAKHVAVRKIADAEVPIRIRFGKRTVKVVEAFPAPAGDVALVRLAEPVKDVQPVGLATLLTEDDLLSLIHI